MILSIPCPECGGSGRLHCSASIWPCHECASTGQARCSDCDEAAVDAWIEGRDVTPLCERHMAQWREDAAA